VRETIDTIRKVIPLRTCSDGVFRNRSRPCLEYQIKRCLAPCCLPVDRDEYERHLREAMLLLSGKRVQLVDQIRAEMAAAAAEERFEDAARLRDRLRAIEKTQERQQAFRTVAAIRTSSASIARERCRGAGPLRPQRQADRQPELPDRRLRAARRGADRRRADPVLPGRALRPDEVLLPLDLEDRAVRAEVLGERKGGARWR
jgi:excinuclease ABC subunit C